MSKATNEPQLLLYVVKQSTPSSAVRMLGEILGLKIDCIESDDLFQSPEFKKITPMCTIPVIKDGDLTICESHAMLIYLTTKYGGELSEKLYPSDFNTRAIIHHLMFWETGVLFIRLKVPAMQFALNGLKAPTEQHITDIEKAYSVLEANLSNRLYIATDHLTLADLSLGTTATAIQAIHKLDDERFPLTAQWLARLNEEEYFKNINQNTVLEFSKMITLMLERNNK